MKDKQAISQYRHATLAKDLMSYFLTSPVTPAQDHGAGGVAPRVTASTEMFGCIVPGRRHQINIRRLPSNSGVDVSS
ncbi:hypothetical protein Cob_v008191 [Colletotrichum orbiculare MAFF 240422]|uniref:Uncharacterized protein n=1 Tax=Colletotrichum orbiculare (strain 104-T / ATCC 96160 / CBS 514.97 / LARS 414 / MAFF 240422) TaxID=1213857 RepID=A0A484FMI7_COLOR|nr:hypothetical protein Cob_v008191 [Colletotrichum orbiculare MAFF 240422]